MDVKISRVLNTNTAHIHPCKYIIIHTTLHMYVYVNTTSHYIILYTHKYAQHI